MKPIQVSSNSEEQTKQWAQNLAAVLKPSSIICLYGELGTGKTTFVKGLAQGLKIVPEKVNSPTFVLMNVYEGRLPIYHFDFYRLEEIKEIERLGYEEFFYGEGVAVVEWAGRLKELLPKERLDIHIEHHIGHEKEKSRHFRFSAHGQRYEDILQRMETS